MVHPGSGQFQLVLHRRLPIAGARYQRRWRPISIGFVKPNNKKKSNGLDHCSFFSIKFARPVPQISYYKIRLSSPQKKSKILSLYNYKKLEIGRLFCYDDEGQISFYKKSMLILFKNNFQQRVVLD